jgi:hypothetical protein
MNRIANRDLAARGLARNLVVIFVFEQRLGAGINVDLREAVNRSI